MAERRKVPVELDLEVARFNRGAGEARVTARVLKAEIEDLGDKADDTSRDMDQLAVNTDVAARQTDKLGDQARGAALELTVLDARIRTLRENTRALGLEFARTFDEELGADLDRQRGELAKLERLRKDLMPGNRNLNAMTFLGVDFSSLLAESRGVGIASLVGVGVAAAPLLSAVLSSAVVGGIGLGGVVGGAVLAAKDERVHRAWTVVGTELQQQLTAAGEAFVAPVERAAFIARRAFADAGIRNLLEQAAKLVDPLAVGTAGLGRNLGRGFGAAVEGAGPTIEMLSRELPDLGDAIAQMLHSLASSGPEAALGMKDFLDVTEGSVVALGHLLSGLTRVYALTRNPVWEQVFKNVPMGGILEVADKLMEGQTALHRYFGDQTNGAKNFATQLAHARDNVEALSLSLDKLFGAKFTADEAQIAAKGNLFGLKAVLKDNKGAFGNTAEGFADRRAVLDAIQDAIRMRDAMRNAGASAETANQAYMNQIAAIKKIGVEAGITKAELDKLAGPYEIALFVTTKGRVPQGIKYTGSYALEGEFARLPGRAAGGPVLADRWYRVDEQQPERYRAFRPAADGWVGPVTQGGASGSQIDYAQLADAIVAAFHNSPIELDGVAVTTAVSRRQTADMYARPGL